MRPNTGHLIALTSVVVIVYSVDMGLNQWFSTNFQRVKLDPFR